MRAQGGFAVLAEWFLGLRSQRDAPCATFQSISEAL
jgi:hypothetical protein